jgi:sugar lactone lactonase YvrE
LTSGGLHPPVLGPPLRFAQLPLQQDGQEIGGWPQGAAIDGAGRYWLALADGGCVVCLGSDGQLLARIPTPVQRPTGLCFGGPDLRTLFLTTARAGLDQAALERWPDSGALFALQVDLAGRPVTPYED